MRWMTRGRGAAPGAVRGLVLLLLLGGCCVAAPPLLAAGREPARQQADRHPAERDPGGPDCRSAAFLSVVDLTPDCR
ncbi:hypothetical protein [Streptomyces sp. NPDC097619]|uniref:hypothetical protein n=1 Tax=Streptomyces sp. NPDC097619 TaxID=3157228 RepID=UPI003327ECC8